MAIRGRLPSTWPDLSTLLVDLDGTLVSMRRVWLELRYSLSLWGRFRRIVPFWRFRTVFWGAIREMQAHRSDRTNFEVLVEAIARRSGSSPSATSRILRESISRDFVRLRDFFRPVAGAGAFLETARRAGYRVAVATNPVWPLTGVRLRLEFGGLGDFPFDFVASSESMTRSKPDPAYYAELLQRVGRAAGECLMIGNDPVKDLPARDVGIRTFLLDRSRGSRAVESLAADPRLDGWGTFPDLGRALEVWARGRGLKSRIEN